MLGDARLVPVLESAAGLPAAAIAARLERTAVGAGNPRDDVALVVVREGAPARSDAQEAA